MANQLVELQQKLTESNRAHQTTLSLKRLNEEEKEKGKRTIAELEQLPPSSASYRSVCTFCLLFDTQCGRMFIREPLPDLLTTLHSMMTKVDEQINALDKKSQYLGKQVKQDEENLNEVVRSIMQQGQGK